MNILEARKLGHEGWIRSPSITSETWIRLDEDDTGRALLRFGERTSDYWTCDLDALVTEDWEPKPIPKKPFEAEVWQNETMEHLYKVTPIDNIKVFESQGWKRIKIREVLD